jgi:hypothetical protein
VGSTGDKDFYAKWERNPGEITFSNISSHYNGKYASFRSAGGTPPTGGDYLLGTTNSGGITGVQISGGSVTIPVYLGNEGGGGTITGPYNGDDQGIMIYLIIKDIATFTMDDISTHGSYTINEVDFSGGNASVNIKDKTAGGDTVEKKLVINDLPDVPPGEQQTMIGVFEHNTLPEDIAWVLERLQAYEANNLDTTTEYALRLKGFIAGADSKGGDLSVTGSGPYTVTARLNVSGIPGYNPGVRWTGNGNYDVFLLEINSGALQAIFMAPNVYFPDDANAAVSYEAFSLVTP